MTPALKRAHITQDILDGFHPTNILVEYNLTPRQLQAFLLSMSHARRTPAPARGTTKFWVQRFRELGHGGVP